MGRPGILNLLGWNARFKKKVIRHLIFILYTWLIYNLYIFVSWPVIVDLYGKTVFLSLLGLFFVLPFSPIIILGIIFINWDLSGVSPFHIFEGLLFFIIALIMIWIYAVPFYFWYKKQTLFKAWIISMLGALAGPGIAVSLPGWPLTPLYISLPVCLFYFFLYLSDKSQQKNDPDNKFVNKIRFMVKWPCLKI